MFTAFADCSACALRLSDYRGLRILPVLRSSCFQHDAASFTQRLRAEGITAAAVAEVRAQMWPSSGSPGCAREPETLYIKDNYRSPF